jgi:uncharacterized GH25 family protein
MKKCLVFITVMLTSFLMQGNEFWIMPNKFIYNSGETVNVRFFTGDNFNGKNWEGNRSKIHSLFFYWSDVNDSCNQHISTLPGDSLNISVIDEGTAMLAFHSKVATRELNATEFEHYLAENRLTDIIEERKAAGASTKLGRENYQRCAKTIFQVGTKTDKTYSKKTGLPIDIIPADNPYSLTKDGDFKVKILFKGKPLRYAPVKVWHRLNEKISIHTLDTDEEGEVTFFISSLGEWMVTSIMIEPLKGNVKADWQTYHGSLTWGYLK